MRVGGARITSTPLWLGLGKSVVAAATVILRSPTTNVVVEVMVAGQHELQS